MSPADPAPNAPSLLSVNVGMPKNVAWRGKTVYTGIWKHPVEGPTMVRRLNVEGDGQGDTQGHGGEQRAVFVYQIQSYRYWEQYLGRNDFSYGQFGENLTVDGLPDDEVCIGDRYRIGEAEFEVTQPRVTCYRVGIRMGEPEMPALLVSHRRPGFYMRVLTEGRIEADDQIVKTKTGPSRMSVSEVDGLLYLPNRDDDKLRIAAEIPALSPGWKQSFSELLHSSDAPKSSMPERPAWDGFRQLLVTMIVPETPTVSSIHLSAPDGSPLQAAQAGQYLTVRIPEAAEPAPVRSYSLSSAPGTGNYRISVKQEPQGVASTYLNRRLRPGDILEVAAPRGNFLLEDDTNPVLFISAGIGVTPVLSMLHALADRRTERYVWWVHSARRPTEHALAVEAHNLITSLPNAREHIFYTAVGNRAGAGQAETGRLTKDKLSELAIPSDATSYICGPSGFMADVQQTLAALGHDASSIHTELFGALAPINPGLTEQVRPTPHQPAGPPGTGPLVTFARSGISTPFNASKNSVLELADSCDVPTRWACRTGVCHTCTTALLSGSVSYQPAPLEPPAVNEVLICCSRPDTDIVLDM